jgi:putative pyruvate formate lyase activating enzyme
MGDLGRLSVWKDSTIRGALSWYLAVAENRRPAKFRIAATLATDIDPATSSEDALWAELNRLTPIFVERWQAIRAGAPLPEAAEGPSLLELCQELVYRMLAHCNFCPWNCRVDRVAGTKFGACKLASRVSSHFHHTAEELFYRGTEGSGTIFFTSCNMRCAFCQNGDISTDKDNGEETDPRTLAAIAWTLRREGCHNINWVAVRSLSTCMPLSTRFACWDAISSPRKRSSRGREGRRPASSRSARCLAPPSMTGNSTRADAVEQQLFHDARKHEDTAHPCRCVAA